MEGWLLYQQSSVSPLFKTAKFLMALRPTGTCRFLLGYISRANRFSPSSMFIGFVLTYILVVFIDGWYASPVKTIYNRKIGMHYLSLSMLQLLILCLKCDAATMHLQSLKPINTICCLLKSLDLQSNCVVAHMKDGSMKYR